MKRLISFLLGLTVVAAASIPITAKAQQLKPYIAVVIFHADGFIVNAVMVAAKDQAECEDTKRKAHEAADNAGIWVSVECVALDTSEKPKLKKERDS